MYKPILILIMLLCVNIRITALSPMGHAPMGVKADHQHTKDEIMVSYRMHTMSMDTLYNGQKSVSLTTGMVPQNMRMSMHMIGGMWAVSDTLTLMAMTHYSYNTMDMTMNAIIIM